MLTGQRDTDIVVAQQLNDRDLLNYCIANKNLGICNDENFWKQRFISRYGPAKLSNKSWKNFYLQVVYYLDKAKNNVNTAMSLAIEDGNLDLIQFFVSKGADDWSRGVYDVKDKNLKKMLTGHRDTDIYLARQMEDQDLVNLCAANPNLLLCNDENFWKQRFISRYGPYEKPPNKSWKNFYLQIFYYGAMGLAAQAGQKDLVDFFISQGADGWDVGMRSAALGGHRELVDFFISKGANYWDWGMASAAMGGHRDLVDFFISKGANEWDWGMRAAEEGGHPDLVEFFRQKLKE